MGQPTRSVTVAARFGTAILVISTMLLAGCGSRSSPTGPSITDSAPSSASVGPVRFDYDAGIADTDKAVLEASVRIAIDYFQKQFHRALLGPVTVSVRNTDGPFAVCGVDGTTVVTVYVRHRDWLIHGPMKRTKMMVHELYEILQKEVGWPGDWGGWLQDGSAEFVGEAAVIDAGMANIDEVRRCRIEMYFAANGPSAAPLEHVFDPGADPTGVRYEIAWLAWDLLLNGPAGVPKIATYWSSDFGTAFGRTEDRFCQEFGQYRRALQSPSGACSSLDGR